ncbi:uncharacterized protein V1516DRAFT_681174 [Lipomyces oligophaga]|uniref:uncharacterized protein n=1 Tax=Lipomyces oligophaga TaxID=45792 RepID=UPI0034D01656
MSGTIISRRTIGTIVLSVRPIESRRWVRSSAFQRAFLDNIPFFNRGRKRRNTELDAAEKKELEAVAGTSSTNTSATGEEASETLKLQDFVHRRSRLQAQVPPQVSGIDKDLLALGIYEIGLKSKDKAFRRDIVRSGLQLNQWKRAQVVIDSALVTEVARLVIALEEPALKNIEWPQHISLAPYSGVDNAISTKQKKSSNDPYAEFLATHISNPAVKAVSIDSVLSFSLSNIDTRFRIIKRFSQLTGREVPDLIASKINSVKDLLDFYTADGKQYEQFGLFLQDPYNPKTTKLYIDPKPFEGTNVKIVT